MDWKFEVHLPKLGTLQHSLVLETVLELVRY